MTGEQIVRAATGRPAKEVLAEEAAAQQLSRKEAAGVYGLTVPQLDRLLHKHGIAWGYPAHRRRRHGGYNQCRFVEENGQRITLADWARRHGVPYSTAVKWHVAGVCEEKLAEKQGRKHARPGRPAGFKSDPDAAWAALQRL